MLANLIIFCVLLAGRVFATFNVTMGNQVLFAADILAIPDSAVTNACAGTCSATNSTLTGCNNDPTCLCQASTVSMLVACEQCMFNFLVAHFQAAPDVRAGSQAILTGYGASCAATNQNVSAAATALTLAPGWDGPQVSVMSTGGTVVTVAVGGLLGAGALVLLSNM